MHYDIDYSLLEGDAKRDKAINDIIDYRGQEWFDSVSAKFLKEKQMPLRTMRLLCSFGGIEGYPVRAWHEKLWPDAKELRDEDLPSNVDNDCSTGMGENARMPLDDSSAE